MFIEVAPSGRSRCLFCNELIAIDELRAGVQIFSIAISDSVQTGGFFTRYYHLQHAAELRPDELLAALRDRKEKVPNRRQLVTLAKKTLKEISEFVGSPKWDSNSRGNLILKGSRPTITVFQTRKTFNWAFDDHFGERVFKSADDAKRDVWLFRHESEMKKVMK